MKNILLGILAISITFISFNLVLRSVDPVQAAQPKNLPAPPLVPTVSDISTNLRPPRIIMMPQRDKGGYSDHGHMKCLKQALLEPRGEKRNNARKNCNQSSQ
tara:strand:- start:52 stop:357 length:306 start_codon:yes stop_codon:yes gene_type:complete